MSFWERIQNIDRRIWYVLLLISLFFPLINPLGLPLAVSANVQKVYDAIDELPEGSIVIVSLHSPGTDSEMWPQHAAIVQHLISKKLKVIQVSLVLESVMFATQARQVYFDKLGYVYGVDHVIMPYKAGSDVAIASMGRDFKALYTEDYLGTPSDQLPLLAGMTGIQDVALIVDFMPGNTLVDYIKQIGGTYDIPITGGVTGVCIPTMLPYVQSGQCIGLLGGMRGGAEYELLIKSPGKAIGGMDAQSLSHLLVIFAIALGNIGFLATRAAAARGCWQMTSDIGIWLGALATIFIYSYLIGDNPLFKFAEHFYIGIAAAHAVVLGVQNINEMAWKPLIGSGKYIMIIPLLMGLMLYSRFIKQWSSLSRIPIAFLVGLAAALSTRGALDASFIKQIQATMVAVKTPNQFFTAIMVATTLTYFFFTAGSKTAPIRISAEVGRWVMMVAFGSAFGNTVMARMSLVIGRLQYLFGSWIKLIK